MIGIVSAQAGTAANKAIATRRNRFTATTVHLDLRANVCACYMLALIWDNELDQLNIDRYQLRLRLNNVAVAMVRMIAGRALSAARARVDGLVILTSPLIFNQLSPIADLTLKARLPTISLFDAFPKAGGFLAYGPNLSFMFKQAAGYVSRILAGEKAGELPIERPTNFELVVNLSTARVLGLSIPRDCSPLRRR